MPSAIDPNFIGVGPVSKVGMRTQLAHARDEITALQAWQVRNNGAINITDHGAVADGVTNNNAAIASALAMALSTGRRKILLPPGIIHTTAPITFNATGTHIEGAGQHLSWLRPVGNFDVIRAVDSRDAVSAQSFSVDAVGMTSGRVLAVNTANRVDFRHIRIESPWNSVLAQNCHTFSAEDVRVNAPRGDSVFRLFNAVGERTDLVRLEDIYVEGTTKTWTGIYCEGSVNTVDAHSVVFVNPQRGIWAAASAAPAPRYATFKSLTITGSAFSAIRLDVGGGYWFDGLRVENNDDSPLVVLGSAIDSVRILGGYIRNARHEGINSGARDLEVIATQVINSSQASPLTFDAVRLLGSTRRALFNGCHLGQVEGIGTTVRHGASLDAGAESVRFVGCDFSGTLVYDVLDNSGSVIAGNLEVVACYSRNMPLNERTSGLEYGMRDGRDGELTPVFTGNTITSVTITNPGVDYRTAPSVVALDPTSAGTGFSAVATVVNGAITNITVLNPGTNYATTTRVVAQSGIRTPYIKAQRFSVPDASIRLESDGAGSVFLGTDAGTGLRVWASAGAANNIVITGQAAGNPARILAEGPDANIDIELVPKGATGRVRITSATEVGAGTIANFLVVNVNGTLRKIPLHNMT